MIKFNELRIDGKKLIIDASVLEETYYENVYISSIKIDTQKTYSESGPSSEAYTITLEESVKHCRAIIEEVELPSGFQSLQDNMYFVYIYTTGTPSSDTPCGMDENPTLGVTFDSCPFYTEILPLLIETTNDCEEARLCINKYLQYKAVEIALETSHYIESITYFNKFKETPVNNTNYGCGCR